MDVPTHSYHDESDEVNFWGGESPRERGGKQCRGCDVVTGDIGGDGEEGEEEEEDDEIMEDEEDDEGEEGEEDDYMAIYGHR